MRNYGAMGEQIEYLHGRIARLESTLAGADLVQTERMARQMELTAARNEYNRLLALTKTDLKAS